MLILENITLERLSQRPLLAAEFPFLKTVKADCGCSNKPRPDINVVKAQIANLSPEAKARFKELVGVPKIKVIYRDGTGRKVVEF